MQSLRRLLMSLNQLVEKDPDAIEQLLSLRVSCSRAMAADGHVRVFRPPDYPGCGMIGLLEVLNGMLASDVFFVSVARDQAGHVQRFELCRAKAETEAPRVRITLKRRRAVRRPQPVRVEQHKGVMTDVFMI